MDGREPVHGMVIAIAGVTTSVLTAIVTVFAYMTIWDQLAPFDIVGVLLIVGGVALGLLSLIYLVPLLRRTEVEKSLALVMGLSAAVGCAAGAWNPIAGLIGYVLVQLITACIANQKWHLYRNRGYCPCGYPRLGLDRSARCPECGRVPG